MSKFVRQSTDDYRGCVSELMCRDWKGAMFVRLFCGVVCHACVCVCVCVCVCLRELRERLLV